MVSDNQQIGHFIRIVYGTLLILLAFGVASASTITVNNGQKIQDAINSSVDGDTIIVNSGTYYENINVSKRLTLRGVGMPIVNAGGNGNAISLEAPYGIILEGFTATQGTVGIYISGNLSSLNGNIASNNEYGIWVSGSSNYNVMTNNIVSNNYFQGFYIYSSKKNWLINNTVLNNGDSGIKLDFSNQNLLTNNNVSSNGLGGFYLGFSNNNTIVANNVNSNYYGVFLDYSNNNLIYQNNFVNSTNITNYYHEGVSNSWYNGTTGNHYSNYDEPGEGCNDTDGNGICDSVYSIPSSSSIDSFPLLHPPNLILLPAIVSVTVNPDTVTSGGASQITLHVYTNDNLPLSGIEHFQFTSFDGGDLQNGSFDSNGNPVVTVIAPDVMTSTQIIITFRVVKPNYYVSGTFSITVNPSNTSTPVLTSIIISPSPVSLSVGGIQQFTAAPRDQNGNPISATITWTSSNKAVGTIDSSGKFTALSAGTTTITAASGTISGTATVTVTPSTPNPVLTSITIDPPSASVLVGEPKTFTAAPKDQHGNLISATISWSSSNTSVGSINSGTGEFTAIAAGTTIVTASSGGVSNTATVTVSAVPTLTLIITPFTPVTSGTTVPITTTVTSGGKLENGVTVVVSVNGINKGYGETVNGVVKVDWVAPTVTAQTTYTITAEAGKAPFPIAYSGNVLITVNPETTTPTLIPAHITSISSLPATPIFKEKYSVNLNVYNPNSIAQDYKIGLKNNANTTCTPESKTQTVSAKGTSSYSFICVSSWDWIPTDNVGFTALLSSYFDFVLSIGLDISTITNAPNKAIYDFTDKIMTGGDLLSNSVYPWNKVEPYATYSVNLDSTKSTPNIVFDVNKNIFINVPGSKAIYFGASMGMGLGSTLFGTYANIANPASYVFYIIDGVGTTGSWIFYQQAYDPDFNYTTVQEPVPFYLPELNLVPEGDAKNFALAYAEVMSLRNATFNAYIRYDGARIDNKSEYMLLQLDAANKYTLQAEQKMVEVMKYYENLSTSMTPLNDTQIQQIKQNISINGLPQVEIEILTRNGLGDSIQNITQMRVNTNPELYRNPKNYSNYLEMYREALSNESKGYIYEITRLKAENIPTPPTVRSSSGGGGGSGGGGSSGENYSNILLIEKYDLQISKDAFTSYRFTDQRNPIMFVNITGNTSLGIITASVEVLKNTSTLVNVTPEGLVYKNANIWVGTAGFATPKNIKEALVRFRVENSWLSDNDFVGSDVKLFRWNKNEWIMLETAEITKDDTYTYFEGKTNMFSPFAISSLKEAQSQVSPATTTNATEQKTASSSETAIKQPSTKATETSFNWILLVFGALVLVGIIKVISLNKK